MSQTQILLTGALPILYYENTLALVSVGRSLHAHCFFLGVIQMMASVALAFGALPLAVQREG